MKEEGEGRGGEGRGGKGRGGKGREGKGRGGEGRGGEGREGKGREGKGREGKGREGKGREGKGREGKGREGKGRGTYYIGEGEHIFIAYKGHTKHLNYIQCVSPTYMTESTMADPLSLESVSLSGSSSSSIQRKLLCCHTARLL